MNTALISWAQTGTAVQVQVADSAVDLCLSSGEFAIAMSVARAARLSADSYEKLVEALGRRRDYLDLVEGDTYVLNKVMQEPSNHNIVAVPVSREDLGNPNRMHGVRKLRALASLKFCPVRLHTEREGV